MKRTQLPGRTPEAGGALAIALLAVTAVTVLSMGFVQLSSSISNRQMAAIENKRAFYLAEAGLAESFLALKAGKSGQLGFDEWPAVAGSGAFWVDVQGLDKNRLRLDSHGLSGSGRASLSLVVEAVPSSSSALGFFTNGNLRVPKEGLIDSFDSSVGTYQEHLDQGLSLEGAVVGSNAAIIVGVPGLGEPARILGDAIPGEGSSVIVQGESVVTGSVAPRSSSQELPGVEVPLIALQPKLDHHDEVPFVIPPGEVGYDEIEVHGKGSLTITGPATVVTKALIARDKGEVVFDTSNGAVDLYVTGRLEIEQEAALTTTSARPGDVRIQFAGTKEVMLRAETDFLGTLYAPRALVTISKKFKLFGALSAQSVDMENETQVHVDRSLLVGGESGDALLDPVTWRVVEVPAPAQRSDPFRMLGVARDVLPAPADAHDLSLVMLSVAYRDRSGSLKTYDGPEEAFDWKKVAEVVSSRRSLTSQHWEHDCSLHRNPRLDQNGYDGSTKSLTDGSIKTSVTSDSSTSDTTSGSGSGSGGSSGSSGSGSSGSSTQQY